MIIRNSLGLPQPFVSAVSSEYEYKPKRYSVTSILKGNREAILQRRHADEIESDVADMVWMIFGSAVHSILENSQETDTQLKENKIEVETLNGYTLSGIFDLYDDSTGVVTDYKTASVWKVIYNDWEDYRKQLLCYCWMLRQMGFDAHTGEIVALLKDHSMSKAEHDASYPQHPVHIVRFEFTDNDIDGIGLWIEQKFLELEACEKLKDEDLPLCTEKERWHKPGKFAVMKDGRKSAVKLFDTKAEAELASVEYMGKTGKRHYVEERKGEDTKCMKYCAARQFCDHWKEMQEGE